MKIYTLGTSHGGAEQNRSCSGTLLVTQNGSYLFDCGGSMESKLVNMGFLINDIKAIFISHMHEDHVGSLSAMVKQFNHYVKTGETVDIYMPEQKGIESFLEWLDAMHSDSLEKTFFHCEKEGEIYNDGNISVKAISNDHLAHIGFPSYSYMICTEGKKVLYTGDLSGDFHDYPQVVFEEEFDAIISELVHFNVEKNTDTIAKSKTKQIIFTHMHPRQLDAVNGAKEKFPFPITVANDGDSFEV